MPDPISGLEIFRHGMAVKEEWAFSELGLSETERDRLLSQGFAERLLPTWANGEAWLYMTKKGGAALRERAAGGAGA